MKKINTHPGSTILALGLILAVNIGANAANFEEAAQLYQERRYSDAYHLFLPMAHEGDPRAQTVIAMMHKFGEAVEVNPEQAFAWYLRAALSGYAPAQYHVGLMFYQGDGTQLDEDKGLMWLQKSADAGYTRATTALSDLTLTSQNSMDHSDGPWSRDWDLRLPNSLRLGTSTTPVAQTASHPPHRVQLGAMTSQAAAERLWSLVQRPNPDLFDSLAPSISRRSDNNGDIYRLYAGPFDNYASAWEFCQKLSLRVETGCLPLISELPSQ